MWVFMCRWRGNNKALGQHAESLHGTHTGHYVFAAADNTLTCDPLFPLPAAPFIKLTLCWQCLCDSAAGATVWKYHLRPTAWRNNRVLACFRFVGHLWWHLSTMAHLSRGDLTNRPERTRLHFSRELKYDACKQRLYIKMDDITGSPKWSQIICIAPGGRLQYRSQTPPPPPC